MNSQNELKRLEGFVAKLLKSFQELKEENSRLSRQLQDRDETIVELKAQLADNDTERNEISNKVSSIIEQIEEWEVGLGEEILDGVPLNDASRQGNLFNPVRNEASGVGGEMKLGSSGYGE